MKKLLKKFSEYCKNNPAIKLSIDLFTFALLVLLTIKFFYPLIKVPNWLIEIYKYFIVSFTFSHEVSRWLTDHYKRKRYHKYFDQGEIYVSAWIIITIVLGCIQTFYPGDFQKPQQLISITLFVFGSFIASYCSKQYKRYKEKKESN